MDRSILIIEDEAAIREILTVPLEAQGYRVTTAADGLEGINAFRNGEFDLVIVDIMMPRIDGYTVCEMIRNESDVPIVILTALDSEEAQIKGFDKLADDYITKPFGAMELISRINALLRRVGQEAHHGPAEALRPLITGGRFYGRQCRGFCRQSLARSEGVQRTQEPLGQLRVGVFRGFVKPLGHRGPVQGPGGDAAQGLKLLL